MPKRKRNYAYTRRVRRRKVYRRRARRRRFKRNAFSPYRSLSRFGLPNVLTMKMTYSDHHDYGLSPGTALPWMYTYRTNDIYDPDRTGTGHQTRNFDQLKNLYRHFLVKACKVSVEVTTHSNSQTHVVSIGSTSYDVPSVPAEISELSKWRSKSTSPYYGKGGCKFTQFIKMTNVFGISKSQLGDEDYSGISAGSPAKRSYLHLVISNVNQTDISNGQFRVRIRLIYYVTWRDSIMQGLS